MPKQTTTPVMIPEGDRVFVQLTTIPNKGAEVVVRRHGGFSDTDPSFFLDIFTVLFADDYCILLEPFNYPTERLVVYTTPAVDDLLVGNLYTEKRYQCSLIIADAKRSMGLTLSTEQALHLYEHGMRVEHD